ncbi:MAG: hypothetical protein AAFV62_07625 [Pseudomonadota bacterium]
MTQVRRKTRAEGYGLAAWWTIAAVVAMIAMSSHGYAQSNCARVMTQCLGDMDTAYAECVAACGADAECLARCEAQRMAADDGCMDLYSDCSGAANEAAAPEMAAPQMNVPKRRPAAPNGAEPRTRSLEIAPTVLSDESALNPRIYLLRRGAQEPNAEFYGYLIVGSRVTKERKRAVAEGIACRLDLADSLEAANAVKNLGLVSLPSTKTLSGDTVNPQQLLDAYDWQRAEKWVAAAAASSGETFSLDTAVIFVGSSQARARFMDARLLAFPDPNTGDPVIADASELSPRYLQRWTDEIIAGVKNGAIRSRQSLQSVMEVHSWLELAGSPLAAVLKISEAQASSAPASCF